METFQEQSLHEALQALEQSQTLEGRLKGCKEVEGSHTLSPTFYF